MSPIETFSSESADTPIFAYEDEYCTGERSKITAQWFLNAVSYVGTVGSG